MWYHKAKKFSEKVYGTLSLKKKNVIRCNAQADLSKNATKKIVVRSTTLLILCEKFVVPKKM